MIINPLKYLIDAKKEKWAVPAFNVHNLETIQAVAQAAYEERAFVIIQTTPGTLKHAGIPYIYSCVETASNVYNIPLALHLDHCKSFDTIIKCIQNGYSSVMIDTGTLPYEENVAMVKKVVEIGKIAEVSVEGEIGRIGGVEDDLAVDDSALTDPNQAFHFAQDTGVDMLAVAIGTAHGEYKGKPDIDFERLKKINQLIDIPIILHGASGVPDDMVKKAISYGISKVNIATELKVAMANAIKKCFSENNKENDPRNYMGAAKEAVKKVAVEKIRMCGASGSIK